MLRIASPFALCAVVAVTLLVVGRTTAPPAQACIGGVGPLEWLTQHAELIVLGEASEVGDATNHAPPATATLSPTATVTPSPGAPTASSAPRVSPVPFTPRTFDLTGIGMTLTVKRVYAGQARATVRIDAGSRAGIEIALRGEEAGRPYYGGTCSLGDFQPRYRQGQQYLVFAKNAPDWYAAGVFVVDGDAIVKDALLESANNGFINSSLETYDRFFAGIPASPYVTNSVYLVAERVPLSRVLRAVAFLRGDPSIAPPETGNAGLAASR